LASATAGASMADHSHRAQAAGIDVVTYPTGVKDVVVIVAVLPAVRSQKYEGAAGAYYTLMMSTGLTFGTISALFGLNHKIITQTQYSYLVGTVIASAVVPTIIANTFFLPRHLLPKKQDENAPGNAVQPPAEPEAV